MRNSYITFSTLPGLAGLLLMLAVGVSAAPSAAEEQSPYPGIDKALHPTLRQLENDHRKLIQNFRDIRAMQEQRQKLERTYGTQARKGSARLVERLRKALEPAGKGFMADALKVRERYTEELTKLRAQEAKFDMEVAMNKAHRERKKYDGLMAEMVKVDAKMDAIAAMESAVAHGMEKFEEYTLYKFDKKTWPIVLKNFPDAVEARRVVMDYRADLEEVKKKQGTEEWDASAARRLDFFQAGLARSIDDLKAKTANAASPVQRELAKAKAKLERVNERLERASKPDRYQEEKNELDKFIEELEDQLKTLEQLGDVQEADGQKKK